MAEFKIADGFVEISARVDEGAARRASNRVTDEVEVELNRGRSRSRIGAAFAGMFVSNPALLSALRTGIPAVLSSPIGVAAITLGGMFAVGFVGSFLAALALGGLGTGFLVLAGFALRENEKIRAAFSETGEHIGKVLADAAKPMVPSFIEALGTVRRMFTEIKPFLTDIFTALGPVLTQAALSLSEGLSGFLEVIARPEVLDGIRLFMMEALPQLARLGPAIGEFFAGLATIAPLVSRAFEEIIDITITLIKILGVFIAIGVSWLIAWDNIWDNVGTWVSQIGKWFRKDLPDAIGGFFSTIKGWLETARGWFDAALLAIVILLNGLIDYIRGTPGRILSAIGNTSVLLIGKGVALIAGLWGGIQDRWSQAAAWLRGLPGRAVSAVGNLGSTLANAGNALISGLRNGFTARWGAAASWLGGIPGRIRSAVGNLGSILYSVGQSVISGLTSGIRDALPNAAAVARNIGSSILSAARSALGVGSPSKVFADQVGRWIPAGIVEGVRGALPAAAVAVRGLTRDLAGTATEAPAVATGTAASSQPSVVYNFAPGSITLDASRIKSVGDLITMLESVRSTARQFGAQVRMP